MLAFFPQEQIEKGELQIKKLRQMYLAVCSLHINTSFCLFSMQVTGVNHKSPAHQGLKEICKKLQFD